MGLLSRAFGTGLGGAALWTWLTAAAGGISAFLDPHYIPHLDTATGFPVGAGAHFEL